MTDHDPVNHPTHYASEAKCSGCNEPIECIDVVRHMSFDQGNAMKYLWRAGKKDVAVQDLKKAVWYIEDMISELEGRKNPNVHRLAPKENILLCSEKVGVKIVNYPECVFSDSEDLGRAISFLCLTHKRVVIMPNDTAPKHCPMYETEK